MAYDPVKNFAKVMVRGGYDANATTIQLENGEGAKLPNPSTEGQYNLVWWNATDYSDPADDPEKEIVRVTAKNGDTLTILRGQEGTVAVAHNRQGKLYKMVLALTKKTYEDLQTIEVYRAGTLIGQRAKLNFDSLFSLSDDTTNQRIDIKSSGMFGGDGSDGDLIISTGTTTLNLGGARIFVKNYNNFSITGNAQLNFTNPHNQGTLVYFKIKGDCTITSTASPAIDLRLLGSLYGNGSTSITGNGDSGTPTYFYTLPIAITGGGGGVYNYSGGSAGSFQLSGYSLFVDFFPYHFITPGSGGGGGSGGNEFSGSAGRGGRGGGALILEVKGNFNFTSTIDASGENGQNATGHWGSGGGGGGGAVLIIYNNLIANTGTINVSGGTGGAGGATSGTIVIPALGGGGGASCTTAGSPGGANYIQGQAAPGGNGANGLSLVIKNQWFL